MKILSFLKHTNTRIRTIYIAVLLVLHIVSFTNGYAQEQDSTSKISQKDTSRLCMRNYIGIVGSYTTNQRTVGIPPEFAMQFGNMPLMSIGINAMTIGDLLLKSKQVRSQVTIEKYLNVYPSSKLLENIRSSIQIGYNIFETPIINVYPFVGLEIGFFNLDSLVRRSNYSIEGGIGVDYFIPSTPLVVGVQAAYGHSFNFRAPADTPNNQHGFAVRAHISFFYMNRYSAFAWE